jgi:pimeloyl-ACP methyl ester carboxylesterase
MNLSRLLCIVLLAFSMAGQAAIMVDSAISNIDRECIDEPVFGGVACIYQANRTATQTIVLVHGLNGRALNDWQYQIPVLATRYHVLTFDLPGFGDSGKGVANYSPREYSRFLHYIIDRYTSGKVMLVGHSMGGAIALRYAASYPQSIEKLVLVDVAGVLHRMAYARQLAKGWMQSNGSDDGRFLSFADRMANKLLSKAEPLTGPIAEFMARQLLKRELLNVDPSVISALTLVNENLSDALRQIDLPTLIVWGQDDLVAPQRTARVLLEYLPNAKFSVIPGASHIPMQEQPEKFNHLFMAYLEADDGDVVAEAVAVAEGGADEARIEVCRNDSNKVYEGRFATLTISNCSQITVRNAHVDELIIASSTVAIEDSVISAAGIALQVEGSDLMITSSQLRGESAIYATGSRLDLAAVTLSGRVSAVQGGRSSSLVFSVSRIDSPLATRSIHEFVKVDKNHPL